MSRKKKSSPAEDIIEIVAHFPWWVGVILAVGLYVVLHAYAGVPAPTGQSTPGQMGDVLVMTMVRTCWLWPVLASVLLPDRRSRLRSSRKTTRSSAATGNQR